MDKFMQIFIYLLPAIIFYWWSVNLPGICLGGGVRGRLELKHKHCSVLIHCYFICLCIFYLQINYFYKFKCSAFLLGASVRLWSSLSAGIRLSQLAHKAKFRYENFRNYLWRAHNLIRAKAVICRIMSKGASLASIPNSLSTGLLLVDLASKLFLCQFDFKSSIISERPPRATWFYNREYAYVHFAGRR